jgi:GntR family transcriptional repressor for pyruvate dehydrogenase complex
VVEPEPPITFERVWRQDAASQAIGVIKEMIVDGRLVSGQKLPPERNMATQLGLSRPTLREAIRTLIAMNILVARHGDGTYVTSLSPELLTQPLDFVLTLDGSGVFDLFDVRRFLEAGAAALAAVRAEDAELDHAQSLVDDVQVHADDLAAVIEHDLELHSAIVSAARNPLLGSLIDSLSGLSEKTRARTVRLPGVARQTLDDHAAIVAALRARDPQLAHQAMAGHLTRVAAALHDSEDGTE